MSGDCSRRRAHEQVLGQLSLTMRFLARQADRLTRCVLVSVEEVLLGLLDRPDVQALVRDVADTAVRAAAAEMGACGFVAEKGYEWTGGADGVLGHLTAFNTDVFQPSLRADFDEILQRDPVRSDLSQVVVDRALDYGGRGAARAALEVERLAAHAERRAVRLIAKRARRRIGIRRRREGRRGSAKGDEYAESSVRT